MSRFTKEQARELVEKNLSAMPPHEHTEKSALAVDRAREVLKRLFRDGRANTVLLYRALQQRREIDLAPLTGDFDAVFDFAPSSPLALFPDKRYDVIFVPLYGFSKEGHRLGRGGGWYDKFLAMQPQAYKIGVGFDSGQVEFAAEKHDLPMDSIVTETKLIDFTK